jgi:transposase
VRGIYDRKVHRVRDLSCGDARIYLELELRRVRCRRCGGVKQERLPWLADSPFYTKRFAFFVGRRCRAETITDVARESHLDWRAIKELDKQYMREQLRRIGTPGSKAIGIDEISIRKGHTCRIVVSGGRHLSRPPDKMSVVPQVAPTLASCDAGRPWLLRPRLSGLVTSPCSGYAFRPKPGN